MLPPFEVVRLKVVDSTQDEAGSRFEGLPLLVLADRQTAGRGRAGKRWQSAPRAIAASLALAPSWPQDTWGRIPLVAGLAARSALPGGVELKWPNDLEVGDAKVGGVLVEGSGHRAVIGLGVNLWWPSPPEGFGALASDDPGPEAAASWTEAWAAGVVDRLAGDPDDWGVEEYRRACRTLGQTVRWRPDGAGRAVDVAPSGELVVETERGRELIGAGEVWEVRRP